MNYIPSSLKWFDLKCIFLVALWLASFLLFYVSRYRDPKGFLFKNSSIITFSKFPSLHYCFWHISFQGLKVHSRFFLQEQWWSACIMNSNFILYYCSWIQSHKATWFQYSIANSLGFCVSSNIFSNLEETFSFCWWFYLFRNHPHLGSHIMCMDSPARRSNGMENVQKFSTTVKSDFKMSIVLNAC